MPASKPLSHKLAAIKSVQLLITNERLSEKAACKRAGVPLASYQRWSEEHRREGEQGLMPDYKACGRPPKFRLSDEEQKVLRGKVLIYDSETLALEHFASDNACEAKTRTLILAELDRAARYKTYCRWPTVLRRLIAATLEDKAALRGPKHLQSISFSPRKGLFFIDEQGREIDLRPHTAWSMDDMSDNVPCQGEEDQLSRQRFFCMDSATDAWLGLEIIARVRDAYRGEDIVRFILRCIEGQGTMPQYLILERGAWDSSFVHGLDLKCILPKYEGTYWGGLNKLFTIINGYSARHKANLESSFNLLQRFVAHTGPDIGRSRGEFERATKLMMAVNAGRKDALEAGFPTMEQRRETLWRACQAMNMRGRHRSATGTVEVPNDLLEMFAEEERRPVPATERWRFLPIKRKATVRGGHVELDVTHYARQSFRFQINGTECGQFLPTGYTVLVAFDPATPALGAYIANGEVGSENRHGWALGEYLMIAPHAANVAQFDLRPGGYEDSNQRRANAAARTAFQSVNPFRRGLAVSQQHDGAGNARIARVGAAATPLISPPQCPENERQANTISPDRGCGPVSEEPSGARPIGEADLEGAGGGLRQPCEPRREVQATRPVDLAALDAAAEEFLSTH